MKILPKAKRLPNGTICETRNVRLTPDEVVELRHYAANEEESLSWFLHATVVLGLETYKRVHAIRIANQPHA
jgi:hypothetical protein